MNAELKHILTTSERILVFSGAGISTHSGIPDYRGPKGVWKTRQPVYFDDFMNSETARIEYWDFKLDNWQSHKNVKPNAIHFAIADLEKAGKVELVLTQNIDGLHRAAGTTEEKLVEIHGTESQIECMQCGEFSAPDPHFEAFSATRKPPMCARCGGILKPATISFGQTLRMADIERAQRAAAACDCVIALGSTLSVYPAAQFPLLAVERGVPYVIINQGATDHDQLPQVTLRLEGDVLEIFPPAVTAVIGGN